MRKPLLLALCALLAACVPQPVSRSYQAPQTPERAAGRPEHPSAWLYRELAREQAIIHWELEDKRRQRAKRFIDNYKWGPNDAY